MVEELVVGRVYQILLDKWRIGLPFEVVALPRKLDGRVGAVLHTPLRIPLPMTFDFGQLTSSRFFVYDRPMGLQKFPGWPKPVHFAVLPEVSPSGDPLDPDLYKLVDRALILGELERAP